MKNREEIEFKYEYKNIYLSGSSSSLSSVSLISKKKENEK